MEKAIIRQVDGIIRRLGGYRELAILEAPHYYQKAGTWNDAHKVVNVIEQATGFDGYSAGCAVDIVTRSIVG